MPLTRCVQSPAQDCHQEAYERFAIRTRAFSSSNLLRAVLAAFDRSAVTVDKSAERSYARCVRGRRRTTSSGTREEVATMQTRYSTSFLGSISATALTVLAVVFTGYRPPPNRRR